MKPNGKYPAALVKKLGLTRVQALIHPPAIYGSCPSKKKTMKEKVTAFVETHERFGIWMCASACVEKKSTILPFLISLPNLQVSPDGICTKISKRKRQQDINKKVR